MRQFTSWFAAVTLVALASTTPTQAATYRFDYDGGLFDVSANVTTDSADIVQSITGSIAGPNGYTTTISSIVPTSTSNYKNLWIWNNVFTADGSHIDWYGLLWENLDGSVANLYLDNGAYILSIANPHTGNYSYWANGDAGTQAVSSVPLPGSVFLLGTGLLGLGLLGRKRQSF